LLVALLYASRQVYFFIWREERNLADLLEILIQHPLLARDIHRPISFLGGSSGSARGYPGLFDEVRHSHPLDGMGSGERFSLGQDRYETPAAIHVFRMVMFRRLRMRAGENSSPGRREAARISTRPQKDLTRLGCRAATHYGQNVICDGAFLAQTGDFRLAANPAFRLDEPPVEGALGQHDNLRWIECSGFPPDLVVPVHFTQVFIYDACECIGACGGLFKLDQPLVCGQPIDVRRLGGHVIVAYARARPFAGRLECRPGLFAEDGLAVAVDHLARPPRNQNAVRRRAREPDDVAHAVTPE